MARNCRMAVDTPPTPPAEVIRELLGKPAKAPFARIETSPGSPGSKWRKGKTGTDATVIFGGAAGSPFSPVGAAGSPVGAAAGSPFPPVGTAAGSPFSTVGSHFPLTDYATQYSNTIDRGNLLSQPRPTFVQGWSIPAEEAPDHTARAITVTLFCCLFFGIIAITKAFDCKTARSSGDREKALKFSQEAKKWIDRGITVGIMIYFLFLLLSPVIICVGLTTCPDDD